MTSEAHFFRGEGRVASADVWSGRIVGEAKAPGKVILFGEHSVVFGYPAIAAPLQRFIRVTLSENAVGHVRLATSVTSPALSSSVKKCLASFGLASVDVSFSGDLPASVGLGSSAALSVALVRACAQATDRVLSDEEVLEGAMAIEREFHGTPSGLDHTVSHLGKILKFTKGQPPQFIALPRKMSAVVWVVSPRGSAKERIEHIGDMARRDKKRVDAIFRDIRRISECAAECLSQGDMAGAGRLMDDNHDRLSELGLSTPLIDDACGQLRRAGAFGAKLTGAGGGGAVVALCEDASKLLQKLALPDGSLAFGATWPASMPT